MSTLRSILTILLILRVEADEGVGALVVLHELHGLDATELAEQGVHVLLGELIGEVLGIDVVVDLAEVAFVAGLIPDHLGGGGIALGVESLGSASGVLEADKAVAAGLVIRVEGDLEGLDVTVAGEVLLELLGSHLLGDAAHKDVVVNDLLGVGAEQVVVEGQGAGWLAWGQLEVAHLLAGEDELILLRDRHDGGVEGAVKVASDLGHTGEDNAGSLLEDGGELGARGLVLRQVVEVQIVLGSLGCIHYHFVFFVGFWLECFVFVCVYGKWRTQKRTM